MDAQAELDTPVLRSDDGPVATLTLNRPERGNLLSDEMIATLAARLAEAGADPAVRVIVLAAKGRIFCAGHDLAEMRTHEEKAEHEALFSRCSALMMSIGELPKPVIARVQGAAVAAGCQLVASCDLAYAVEGAKFAVSGVNLGLFCSTPAVALSRVVTPRAALELLLTGEAIPAARAAELGLINRAVAPEDLDGTVADVARQIAEKLPAAVTLGKVAFHRQLGLETGAAYRLASERIAENMGFPATKAAIDRFLKGER